MSTSNASSSPQKLRSKQASTPSARPAAREQKKLKEAIREDIDGHTWQFPTEQFARILSPKRLKQGAMLEPDTLLPEPYQSQYNFLIDDDVVKNEFHKLSVPDSPDGLDTVDVKLDYDTLARLSNQCAQLLHKALEEIRATLNSNTFAVPTSEEHRLSKFQFAKFDRHTKDGSHRIKSDLISILSESALHKAIFLLSRLCIEIGRFSLIQNKYPHRGVTIGNILKSKVPTKRDSFVAKALFGRIWFKYVELSLIKEGRQNIVDKTRKVIEAVQELADKFGVSAVMKAIIISDGDLAATNSSTIAEYFCEGATRSWSLAVRITSVFNAFYS